MLTNGKSDTRLKASKPRFLIPLFDTHSAVTGTDADVYEYDRPFMTEYLSSFTGFDARGDYEAVRKFLKSHEDTPTTFNNYRTQVERVLLWAWNIRGKSILSFLRSDVEDFLKFCRSPDSEWISTLTKPRFVVMEGVSEPNPEWRPFLMRVQKATAKSAQELNRDAPPPTFTMAESSLKQCYAVINSLFGYCAADKLMDTNPCQLIKREKRLVKSKTLNIPMEKSLSKLQWDFMLETAELMADEDPATGERALFCIVMMFGCYLRVSDLVGNGEWVPEMASFVREREAWWYHVIGKGGVQAKIAVKPDCIEYLKRYRRTRGLSDYPSSGEAQPLLTTVHGRGGLKARKIRMDVQAVMDRTLERMKEAGFPDYELTELRTASLHWLRHTGATFDAPYRSPKNMQADLRHKSLSTTYDCYYHPLSDERVNEVSKLSLRR